MHSRPSPAYAHEHDVGLAHQRPVDGAGEVDALLLPTRQVDALLPDLGHVARLQQLQVPPQRTRRHRALCVMW